MGLTESPKTSDIPAPEAPDPDNQIMAHIHDLAPLTIDGWDTQALNALCTNLKDLSKERIYIELSVLLKNLFPQTIQMTSSVEPHINPSNSNNMSKKKIKVCRIRSSTRPIH